jgi:hypothetical protein
MAQATPWAIVLCKFSDFPNVEPQPADFFRRFMTIEGLGQAGEADYWRDMSYGAIDFTGSMVFGWYQMSYSLLDFQSMSRFDKIMAGINTGLAQGVDFSTFYGIVVMLNRQVDSGAIAPDPIGLTLNGVTKPYGVLLLDPGAWYDTFASHEMGHGYGLQHSWSTPPDTEYGDPWDIMSAMTFGGTWPYFQGNFGDSGPGLIAPYREKLGWLTADRIVALNQIGGLPVATSLGVLSDSVPQGTLMTRVFHEAADPRHYYTLEYRRRIGWDQSLSKDAIVLHEVRKNGLAYYLGAMSQGDTINDTSRNLLFQAQVLNTGAATISIDRPGDREFYYDTASSSLGVAQTVQWWWWFDTQPTLLTIVPIPEVANIPLQCSQPMTQRNSDDTVTYFVNVTNLGSQPVPYHLSAKLTR